ncbi:hypothetical protein KY363_00370 [Candidatus Woesearchaeota archaeon]|nr:hypothetical protein [Candidatus Woesearchaeota archaeon]
MGFMQKNVNLFLFLLVLVVAGTLAGSSVYYNENFDKLTGRYDDASANLSQCRADLEQFRFNLNKTMRSLNTTTQDIKRYDELYTNKSEELKSTQSELDDTETALKQTKTTLVEETALKEKYKKEWTDEVQIRKNLEQQNNILETQKLSCEASLSTCSNKANDAEDCIDDFLADYDAALTSNMQSELEDCKP